MYPVARHLPRLLGRSVQQQERGIRTEDTVDPHLRSRRDRTADVGRHNGERQGLGVGMDRSELGRSSRAAVRRSHSATLSSCSRSSCSTPTPSLPSSGLLCLDTIKGLPVAEDGTCAHPFMMLADLGKTFGKANAFNKDNPGSVNLKAWAAADVWRGESGCIGDMDQSFYRHARSAADQRRWAEVPRRSIDAAVGPADPRSLRMPPISPDATRRRPSMTGCASSSRSANEIVNRTCANPAV